MVQTWLVAKFGDASLQPLVIQPRRSRKTRLDSKQTLKVKYTKWNRKLDITKSFDLPL